MILYGDAEVQRRIYPGRKPFVFVYTDGESLGTGTMKAIIVNKCRVERVDKLKVIRTSLTGKSLICKTIW